MNICQDSQIFNYWELFLDRNCLDSARILTIIYIVLQQAAAAVGCLLQGEARLHNTFPSWLCSVWKCVIRINRWFRQNVLLIILEMAILYISGLQTLVKTFTWSLLIWSINSGFYKRHHVIISEGGEAPIPACGALQISVIRIRTSNILQSPGPLWRCLFS